VIRYVLPVLWLMSYLYIKARNSGAKSYNQSDSTGGNIGTEAESKRDLRLHS